MALAAEVPTCLLSRLFYAIHTPSFHALPRCKAMILGESMGYLPTSTNAVVQPTERKKSF